MFLLNVSIFSCCFLLLFIFLFFPLCLSLISSGCTYIVEWTFFSSSVSPMVFSFVFDLYGVLFSCIVLFISFNVLIFSKSYMSDDLFLSRFTYMVLLFVLSMNFLIFIPNLISLLLGWDGLGLVSFLLVIYYQNSKSVGAGMITALTNRVGDVFILLSIGWFLCYGHWGSFSVWDSSFFNLLGVTIMLAAMTKSAQFPFSSWLPAAMAAPTPVSALVHSSTLVTAGVFLLFRFYPSLSCSYYFNFILLILGTITALMAGLSAMVECDMKKIIALSTLSQLGVMMVSMGMGAPFLSFFHLLTHALFKALLFLCAGTLIHLHGHSQDLRFMGNIGSMMPLLSSSLVISNLALCGAPFMAGFYSKDMVLEFCLYSPMSFIVVIMFFFATGLTASYTIRFLSCVVWGSSSSLSLHSIMDKDSFVSIPTMNLSVAAIVGGSALNWLIISSSEEFILPFFLKMLTLTVTIIGGVLSWYFSSLLSSGVSFLVGSKFINDFFCSMWFLTPLSSQNLMSVPFFIGHFYYKVLDQGWEELFGGQGVLDSVSSISSSYQFVQDNIISLHIFLGSIFILFFVFFLMV